MSNVLNVLSKPCGSCPWVIDNTAADIPGFNIRLAKNLANTCPNAHGGGPEFGAALFACHQSKTGNEIVCAGWLATVGHRHPTVRMALMVCRLNECQLEPKEDWPAMHSSYPEVLQKLKLTNTKTQCKIPASLRTLKKAQS